MAAELQAALRSFTTALGSGAAAAGQAAWLYGETCRIVQHAPLLWHDCALAHLAAGQRPQALAALRRARTLAPSDAVLAESLDNMTSLVVERWHFRMLNDAARNTAYAAALQHAMVRLGAAVVLDIGAGSGILSVLAMRAGAAGVVACEMNPALAVLARECVAANGVAATVAAVDCHSSQVHRQAADASQPSAADSIDSSMSAVAAAQSINNSLSTKTAPPFTTVSAAAAAAAPSVLLPARGADVIVTELVDAGLLGEHIVPVLADAVDRLLAPGGLVIPDRATVTLALVECDALRLRRTLVPAALPPAVCALAPWQHVEHQLADAYTCEPLALLPHALLAAPAEDALTLHFVGCRPASTEVTCKVERSGRIDAAALWWDMHLLPDTDDPAFCVSTHPIRGADSGWDQALYPLGGVLVEVGDVVTLRLAHDTTQFAVSLVRVIPAGEVSEMVDASVRGDERMDDQGVSQHDAQAASSSRPASSAHTAGPQIHAEVGELDMALMNDGAYQSAMLEATAAACHAAAAAVSASAESEAEAEGTRPDVVLLLTVRDWSYWALAAVAAEPCARAVVLVDSEAGATALRAVARAAGLLPPRLLIRVAPPAALSDADAAQAVDALLAGGSAGQDAAGCTRAATHLAAEADCNRNDTATSARALTDDASGADLTAPAASARRRQNITPVVVVVDAVEGSGLLRQGIPHQVAALCVALRRHPRQSSVTLVPATLTVRAQVFASPVVRRWNAVDPTRTAGVDVQLFNAFGVGRYRELDIAAVPDMHMLTDPATALVLDWELLSSSREGQDCTEVDDEGLFHSQLVRETALPVTADGSPTGVALWFVACDAAGRGIYSTGPETETLGTGAVPRASHVRQAACMVDEGSGTTLQLGGRVRVQAASHPAAGVTAWLMADTV